MPILETSMYTITDWLQFTYTGVRRIEDALNYPFKTLCLFIKLLLFSSLSYHYGLIFILLFALIFIHSCIVYGKT